MLSVLYVVTLSQFQQIVLACIKTRNNETKRANRNPRNHRKPLKQANRNHRNKRNDQNENQTDKYDTKRPKQLHHEPLKDRIILHLEL